MMPEEPVEQTGEADLRALANSLLEKIASSSDPTALRSIEEASKAQIRNLAAAPAQADRGFVRSFSLDERESFDGAGAAPGSYEAEKRAAQASAAGALPSVVGTSSAREMHRETTWARKKRSQQALALELRQQIAAREEQRAREESDRRKPMEPAPSEADAASGMFGDVVDARKRCAISRPRGFALVPHSV